MDDVLETSVSGLVADYAALHCLLDRIAAGSAGPLSEREVAEVAVTHEQAARRMGSIGLRRVMDVADRGAYGSVGCRSLREFVDVRMRVPHSKKRLRAALELESTHALTGEKLDPRCPATAQAMADGDLAQEHVDAVLDVMDKVPTSVGPLVRDAAEASLAEFARTLSPREITKAGVRILAHLDPDGRLTDDRDRARQRKLTLGAQDAQLMSTLRPLAFGRTRRLASESQRFVLFAQYGGCSKPDCPAPFSLTEIHHAERDWADGGLTDIGDLAPACGPDNRSVGTAPGQWQTTKVTTGPDRGRYAWRQRPSSRPPDKPRQSAEPRVNHRHRIDQLLRRHGYETTETDDPWRG